MAFKDTYRLEKVYYENMLTLLKGLKALKENPSADEITKVNEILDDTIACNESIIIIYKNLGELYAEVAQKFVDLLTDLKAIRDDLEMWKNEINEKIDDVNNYLMGHIRDLDDRVTSLEGRVSDLEDRMDTAEDDIDALEGRMDTAEGDIDALEGRMDTAEGDIDALEGRMDTAEDDIDGLQDDVSDLQQNKQDKMTAGFGIEIDTNNEISVDTNDVQEKLIAGQNITFTPDATDPTKTVIDAQGGANYSAGSGINIDSNNVISNSKDEVPLGNDTTTTAMYSLGSTFSTFREIGSSKHYKERQNYNNVILANIKGTGYKEKINKPTTLPALSKGIFVHSIETLIDFVEAGSNYANRKRTDLLAVQRYTGYYISSSTFTTLTTPALSGYGDSDESVFELTKNIENVMKKLNAYNYKQRNLSSTCLVWFTDESGNILDKSDSDVQLIITSESNLYIEREHLKII